MAFRTARNISVIRKTYSDLVLCVYSLTGVVINIDGNSASRVLPAPLSWQRWLNLYPVELARRIGLQGVTASYQATPHGRCSPPVHADLLGTYMRRCITPARLFFLSHPSGLLHSKYPKNSHCAYRRRLSISPSSSIAALAPLHMIGHDDDKQEDEPDPGLSGRSLLLSPNDNGCSRSLGALGQSRGRYCSRDPPWLEPSSPQTRCLRSWPHKASSLRPHPCRTQSQNHDFCFTVVCFKRAFARHCVASIPSSLFSLPRPATTRPPLSDSCCSNLQLSLYQPAQQYVPYPYLPAARGSG